MGLCRGKRRAHSWNRSSRRQHSAFESAFYRILAFDPASKSVARAGPYRGHGSSPRRAHRNFAVLRARAGIRGSWLSADEARFNAARAPVSLGDPSRLWLHAREASERRLSFHALFSLGCWLGALAGGRLIAFAVETRQARGRMKAIIIIYLSLHSLWPFSPLPRKRAKPLPT